MVVATSPTMQRQHTTTTVVTPPLVVATEAMLVTAHQLLNNPLPPHASPSAAEQWRHDVD
jgi:hypothetical protein